MLYCHFLVDIYVIRIKGAFPMASYLLTTIILTVLLFSLLSSAILFAQDNSTKGNKIFVCKLVQYCSNPATINEIPQEDVVSNVSVMVTPDLYNNVVGQDISN